MYPRNAIAKGIEGTVIVQVKLDSNGEVADVAVQTGPDELRRGVIQSVLNWQFTKDVAGSTRTINVDFTLPTEPASARQTFVACRFERPLPLSSPEPRRLADIEITGLSDDVKNTLLARIPVRVGDTIGSEQFMSVLDVTRDFDEHLSVEFCQAMSGDIVVWIGAPGSLRSLPYLPSPPSAASGIVGALPEAPPTAQEPSSTERIIVAGDVQAKKLVSQMAPVYPPIAKQSGVSGTVALAAVIGKDGSIQNLHIITGHPLLTQAALDAVKNWVYQPTVRNGEPVEVATTISVNFALRD
jgi:TonB family protein